MFQRPLICTDLTDGLQRFVNFIPSFAANGATQIVFLHTVPFLDEPGVPKPNVEKIERAQAILAPALKMVPAGIEVKIEVQSGRPLDAILRTVSTYHVDGIILGTQTRSALTEKLFGSTTTGLTERTQLPLLALRPPLLMTYTEEELSLRCQHLTRDLLVAYDGSDAANYTINHIKQFAKSQRDSFLRSCVLCWVIAEGGRLEISESDQQKRLEEKIIPVQKELEDLGLRVPIEVRRGNPVEQIISAAQAADVSAIALSSNSLNRFMEWSSPSAATEILRRSWHPVLFFPPKR